MIDLQTESEEESALQTKWVLGLERLIDFQVQNDKEETTKTQIENIMASIRLLIESQQGSHKKKKNPNKKKKKK